MANKTGIALVDRSRERREEMVCEQIIARGVLDARVLDAVRRIPRELFVPEAHRERAYDDCPLPVGPGQTISQPYIVAYMSEHLRCESDHRVFEVGTGTGYQSAILGLLGGEVYSMDCDGALVSSAQQRLELLGLGNVHCRVGDGSRGYGEYGPYDRILVTAGAPEVPEMLKDQLRTGGLMVIPVGGEESQVLMLIQKQRTGIVEIPLIPCRFVKLVGAQGWPV